MNLSETLKNLVKVTKTKIVENVSNNIENAEKKTKVDANITSWILSSASGLGVVQKFIITQYIIPLIPTFTQSIYDCLKQKIEGLTE